MIPRYRAVLLDVGETLLGPRESFGAVYARVFAELGVVRRASDFESAVRAAWDRANRRFPPGVDRYRQAEGGEPGYWLSFVRETLSVLEAPTGDPALAEAALPRIREAFRSPDAWFVWPDVKPSLDDLRGRGVRLAVVSNWDSRLPELLESLDLLRRFDALAVSSLEGMEKPDPRLFRAALDRLGVAPGEAVHVGDLPELDGDGANRAGIDAALVDRRGRLAHSEGALPHLGPLPRLAADGRAEGVRIRSGRPGN